MSTVQFSVQREILHNILEVSYIGSDTHKETSLTEGNPFVLGTKTRLFNAQPGVAPSTFSYLDTFRNVAAGSYHSMAVGLSKRFSDVRFLGNLPVSTFVYLRPLHRQRLRLPVARFPRALLTTGSDLRAPRISTSRTL